MTNKQLHMKSQDIQKHKYTVIGNNRNHFQQLQYLGQRITQQKIYVRFSQFFLSNKILYKLITEPVLDDKL
jgi:hypothetical protein